MRTQVEAAREKVQNLKMEKILKKNWNSKRRVVGQTLKIKEGPLLAEAAMKIYKKNSDDDLDRDSEYSHDSDFD